MTKIKLVMENSQTKWIDITDEQANKIIFMLKIKYTDFIYG